LYNDMSLVLCTSCSARISNNVISSDQYTQYTQIYVVCAYTELTCYASMKTTLD